MPELQLPERLLDDLVRRAPEDLRAALVDAVRHFVRPDASGAELLDAIDEARAGLGVAIGRGATGEDQRYEQLGRLCAWLYDELGRPRNTRYAALLRVAAGLDPNGVNCDET